MAELAFRDGVRPPADLPRGECIMTSLPGGGIRIDQADPRILISAELLDAVRAGSPWAVLQERPLQASMDVPVTYVGAVLKIHGVSQTVIYHIVDYVPSVHGYVGQWPD